MSGARMKAGCGLLLAVAFAVGLSAQAAKKGSARERLIGAWRLVRIDASGPDPKSASGPQITRGLLVGKDLPRRFEFTAEGQLLIRSTRPDEHWSVTWEHD